MTAPFVFVTLLLAACACPGESAVAVEPARALPFRATSVEGKSVELGALLARGPVVLDFWATWCKPCVVSLPAIERLQRKYRDQGLSVVAISIDGPRNFSRVRPFASKLGLSMPVVLDEDGELQQHYQVTAVPTSVLIAPDGRIVRVHAGYLPGQEDELESAVRALLPAVGADSAR